LGCILGLVTKLVDFFNAGFVVTGDVYWGLIFLVSIFWSLRYFVDKSQVSNPNQWVRRAMISSMLRLLGVLTFLLISVLRQGKPTVVFVLLFGLYFILFLLFEMSEKRINLRPNSEDGSAEENT
jgi:Ca2+/Na+ antiporter